MEYRKLWISGSPEGSTNQVVGKIRERKGLKAEPYDENYYANL
jgi:hypothetical protein